MKKTVKTGIIGIAIIGGVIGIAFLVISFSIDSAFGLYDKVYSPNDLIKEFKNNKDHILSAKKYFNSITPKYKKIGIEFNGDKIARLEIDPVDTGRGSDLTTQFLDWNLSPKKVDSILPILGWTHQTLNTIKKSLDDANCISIVSGDPSQIGFKRSGMGMYFFDVFDKPIADNLSTRYNDSCQYIYVNKNLVLEYGGGAVGNQCFFNKHR